MKKKSIHAFFQFESLTTFDLEFWYFQPIALQTTKFPAWIHMEIVYLAN